MSHFYRQARFSLSVHQLNQLPVDEGYEVVFAGRSNSGKSSAINAITGQKNLARTSKTPGRTQQIIFFTLDEQRRFVDLPGYGYAKVAKATQQHWQQLLEVYLNERQSIRGLVLMMDIRHPLMEFDEQLLDWSAYRQMPVHILLTKADKLSYNKGKQVLQQVQAALSEITSLSVSVQCFSALKRLGLEECQMQLDKWFDR